MRYLFTSCKQARLISDIPVHFTRESLVSVTQGIRYRSRFCRETGTCMDHEHVENDMAFNSV